MKRAITFFILLTSVFGGRASPHDLEHSVTKGNAIVIQLQFADNTKFSYEKYEVFRPEEKIPFQVGRTDKLGRIVFIPDKGGAWRVRAFSEDGHGVDFRVSVDRKDFSIKTPRAPLGQPSKILIGVAIILGIFGIISLVQGRKSR